jgi:hypothetical protein
MKKQILAFLLSFIGFSNANAQVTIDTVSMGAGYANQKWYSLEDDEQGSSPKNNWDIAFDCSSFGASIRINSITGTTLWKYPSAGISGWATLDTTGLSTWPKIYNSDTSWLVGAFDQGITSSNPFDLGWGIYNSTTHIVTGDSLYVIKLADNTYRKLWIEALAGGIFTFKYANIDGSNLENATLTKTAYTGKTLGYYSLQTNAAVDREPLTADWDLTFCQYTGFIPSAYTVAGILSSTGTRIAQVNNVGNTLTFYDWENQTYTSPINIIGYDWKSFNGSAYVIIDSLVYFVKTNEGDVWKVIPTGFGGGSTGNFIFSKEKIATASITDIEGNTTALLSVYPNPSSTGTVTIVYDLTTPVSVASLRLSDMTGKIVHTTPVNQNSGLHTYTLDTSTLNSGVYFVHLTVEGTTIQQKIIIQ